MNRPSNGLLWLLFGVPFAIPEPDPVNPSQVPRYLPPFPPPPHFIFPSIIFQCLNPNHCR